MNKPLFKREKYLKRIRSFYHDTAMIKVITGVRRCGKSSIMHMIADELKQNAVPNENIIFIDLDSRGFRQIKKPDQLDDLIKKYDDIDGIKYLFIDEISDPNLMNVSSSIKKYATLEKVKFVFYDYLFTSPSLLDQFSDSKIREDVALTMLSTQLKDLAKDYNLFISSATQVNAEAMNGDGFKNETCIRGSKGIVDKCDTGCIVVKVEEKEKNFLNLNLKEAGKPPLPYEPTHRFDIYKNRRGQYKNISIWSYINLGTGERHDLYITTMSGKIIKEFEVSSSTYWEEEIKFG